MKAVLTGLVLSLASVGAYAQSLDERLVMATESVDIKEIVEIPIRNLKAVESEGQILYMSDNGRYVLVGQIYDLWTRQTLDTMNQIRRSVTHLSFDDMNMPIEELNSVSVGKGRSKVVAFVDPKCESCHTLIKQAQGLSDDLSSCRRWVKCRSRMSNTFPAQRISKVWSMRCSKIVLAVSLHPLNAISMSSTQPWLPQI